MDPRRQVLRARLEHLRQLRDEDVLTGKEAVRVGAYQRLDAADS